MSDLDDEELEATRRLNGVAKKSNIERTDINVGNIEKDIKRCEQLIKPEHANWIGISNQLAIAHLIKRIKELEEEKKNRVDFQQKYIEVTNLYLNSIPKQEVKNKIERAKHNKRVGNTAYEYTEEDVWDIVKDELEKLLEDR